MKNKKCYICRLTETNIKENMILVDTDIGKLYRCSDFMECKKRADIQTAELMKIMNKNNTTG